MQEFFYHKYTTYVSLGLNFILLGLFTLATLISIGLGVLLYQEYSTLDILPSSNPVCTCDGCEG